MNLDIVLNPFARPKWNNLEAFYSEETPTGAGSESKRPVCRIPTPDRWGTDVENFANLRRRLNHQRGPTF
jgi:hypothetical protein